MPGNARPADGMPKPLRIQTLRSARVGVYSTGERSRGVRLASNAWMCGPEQQLWGRRLGECEVCRSTQERYAARASRIRTCEQPSRKPASPSFAHGLVSEQSVEADAAIEWEAPGNAPRGTALGNHGGGAPKIAPRAPPRCLTCPELQCVWVWLIRLRLRSHEAKHCRQRSRSPPFFSHALRPRYHRLHRNRDGEVNEVAVHVGTTSCRHSPRTES